MSGLLHASHCHSDQRGQTANLVAGDRAMALNGLGQLLPFYHADVVRLGRAILPKACFSGSQQKVGGTGLVNRRGKRNYQNCI